MLGQPIYILTPDVVGVHMTGRLNPGVTATDLVLTITELLRKVKRGGQVCRIFRRRRGIAVCNRPCGSFQHVSRLRRNRRHVRR